MRALQMTLVCHWLMLCLGSIVKDKSSAAASLACAGHRTDTSKQVLDKSIVELHDVGDTRHRCACQGSIGQSCGKLAAWHHFYSLCAHAEVQWFSLVEG